MDNDLYVYLLHLGNLVDLMVMVLPFAKYYLYDPYLMNITFNKIKELHFTYSYFYL